MKLTLKGDNYGFELQFMIKWKSLMAMLKALLAVAAAFLSLLAAPEIAKLCELLGLR
jgi:hypothetical protein